MKLTATSVAWVFAASFYAAAAIGFIPNPLLGPHGLFMTNTAHNLVHLLTGVGFTVVALPGQFLIKDLALLGIALWTLGETWKASQRRE